MKPAFIKTTAIIFILVLAFVLSASYVCSEETKLKPVNALERGIGQYKHENYDEALVSLKKAREESPTSSLAAYYLGLTCKQLQQYEEALPNLKDATRLHPKIAGALIELIDCYYQLNRLEEAKDLITEAELEGIRPAQVAFLKGLILAKDNRDKEAIESFDKAKELDKSMAQACDYQTGLVLLKTNKLADAEKALTRVMLADPRSNMANFANEYVDVLNRKKEADKPLKINAGFAWQYDDNVVLMPDDSSAVTNVSDQGDSREVVTTSVEYNQKFSDRFGVRGLYSFYFAKQNRLHFYDTMTNSFIGQPTIYLDNGLLTFPSGYIYTRVNDSGYLSQATVNSQYNFTVGSSNMGQLFMRYNAKDYLWTPVIQDENRDGNSFGGGCGWYYFYAKSKGFINTRYSIDKEATHGCNWDSLDNRVAVTALVPLLDKLNVTVTGDFFAQNFSNSHSVFHAKRKDKTYTLSTLVAYKFYKDWEVQLQYTHIHADSNISVYEYKRNIYSVGVNLRF